MSPISSERPNGAPPALANRHTVLELTVRNHPGVMSHVCGLFARRAFNVDGILCMPVGDGRESRIWLLVEEDRRLEQMVRQVLKLEDVLQVRCHEAGHEVFVRLEEFFRSSASQPVERALTTSKSGTWCW